jgi:hypothetical protein
MKTLLIFLLVWWSSLIFPRLIQANQSIVSNLSSQYAYDEILNTTKVEHHLSLENTTPIEYLKQFAFQVNSTTVENVRVTVDGTEAAANVVTTGEVTSIAITFSQQKLGTGTTHRLEIHYTDPSIAFFKGETGLLFIPGPTSKDTFSNYSIRLITPAQYNTPSHVYPEPTSVNQSGTSIVTHFDRVNSPLIVQFGQQQTFAFDLQYDLANPTNSVGIIQVPLPPQTAYQEVWYESLDPQPTSLEPDLDGNWIATFYVAAQQTQPVRVVGQAKVLSQPQQNFNIKKPAKIIGEWQLPGVINSLLTLSAARPDQVMGQLQSLVYLELPKNNLPTRTAHTILLQNDQPSSTTTTPSQLPVSSEEAVNLFVALARNQGLMARKITGYAVPIQPTQQPLAFPNQNLHTWAEYYDEDSSSWQMADPSWQLANPDTNYTHFQDLQRLSIAINGQHISTPQLSALIRPNSTASGSVTISPLAQFNPQPKPYKVELKPATIFGMAIPGKYHLIITNTTGHEVMPFQVHFESTTNAFPIYPSKIERATFLPFATIEHSIVITNSNWFQSRQTPVQLTIDDEVSTYQLTAGPKLSQLFYRPFFIIAVVTCLVGSTLGTGSVLVYQRHRRSALRRQSQKSARSSS